ncbi:MAG: NTP transferase domain-containing protein [Planctomycetia bacterium]
MSRAPVLIVLAGGAATRLGSSKAGCDLGGGLTPLDSLLAAGAVLRERALVFGAYAQTAPVGCELIANPRWSSGRLSSVQAAVARFPGRDLLLAPVDVPLVPAGVFRALLESWQAAAAPAFGWLAPQHAGSGRHGHPLLIGRGLLEGLHSADPDRPLKHFRRLAQPCWSLPCHSAAVLDDLDTPEDLATLRARRGFRL